jgi:thiamine biosynthesis protein ThiI
VTGESLGQVASQTLHNLARIDEAATMPVLRPLIGMDKIEITDQARQLDTLETSNEPDADCCTLFVPEHPSTRLSQEEIAAMEARLDIPALVRAGVEAATMETFEFPPGAGSHPGRRASRERVAPPPRA